MKLLLLAILGMIIIAPIVLDNAFGETTATVTLEKSFTVDADPREATPRGLTFNDDGTKMYFDLMKRGFELESRQPGNGKGDHHFKLKA